MCPKPPNTMKNLIEMREIKNFKTQKFKHRIDQLSYYSHLHFHHPLQCNCCTTNFNCLRIYQVTPSSSSSSSTTSSSSSSSAVSDISLVQIASTLQLSIISTSCFKMYFIIILLLSIVASHITSCQTILERDNNIVFFSKNNNNNLSEHLLQYVGTKQNVINKRLIVDSTSTINDEIVKYKEEQQNEVKFDENSQMTVDTIGMRWLNRNPESNQQATTSDIRNSLVATDLLEVSTRIHVHNKSTSLPNTSDDQRLFQIVMEGLGLERLPDFKKANISQLEYATKYNEYLDRVRQRNARESQEADDDLLNEFDYEGSNSSLSLVTIAHNSSEARQYRQRRSPSNKEKAPLPNRTILLRFPLNIDNELEASDIEEANIRLLLITSPALATSGRSKQRHRNRGMANRKSPLSELDQRNRNSTEKQQTKRKYPDKPQKHILNMKVYQLVEPKGRVWIDGRKIEIQIDRRKMDETTSQWLQFDVTKAVEGWLVNKQRNLGLEIQCDNCFRNGARIIDDLSGDSEEDVNSPDEFELTPVLNIIGRLGTHREKRSKHYHNQMTEKPQRRHRKSDCYKDNQRCCRHTMEVVFKEIKGFEFIMQPKVFDAGYCRGRCPPRYNPAHHHALLQSLIWKQDRTKVPRPCCAPSKLIELEVLHVDEKDNEKLKISTWTDMRVLECACS